MTERYLVTRPGIERLRARLREIRETDRPRNIADIEEALARTDPLPIGWETVPGDPASWTRKVLGLLVTWAGLVLGAPFWFDVLKRLVGLGRPSGATTGKPPTDRSDD